ncbi:4570_t:CDS:2 [Dentiscutata erythropus]|uniref:4570_t:CDS:1 n=1 Tax=Dentiscutata erythropus TaxID=1348616 RepID=A0A9N9B2H1_9GLOM|nr:4570_t:CDS:2 [Dentiscutata erythropus]
MSIFGKQINFIVFFGLDGSQRLELFKWLLVTMAIFLTAIPTSILSLAQNRNRSLAFTAVISPEDSQALPGIVLTPHLTLNGEFVCVMCAWMITLFGVFNFMRKNNIVGQFFSMFLIAFTVIQTVTAAYNVLFSNSWIFKILSGSLQKAYNLDPDLIKEFEYEFSCDIINRPGEFFNDCYNTVLMNRFGPQLFYIAKIIFFSRLVQLIGVLMHTFIFDCITMYDIRQHIYGDDGEECPYGKDKDIITNTNADVDISDDQFDSNSSLTSW